MIRNSEDKTKQHFNNTASDYNNSSDGKFVEPMYEIIVQEIDKLESGKILDVGCGNGNLFRLLPDGKYELFGVDFSENMIGEAKKNCEKKATFSVADAESLPFDNDTFDVIVCNASFHHYVHPNTVLKEMHRVLKNGGKVLIGDPYIPTVVRPVMNVLTRFSDSGDYHFYGLDEMKKLFLKNGFKPITSVQTGKHTAFHIAEKQNELYELKNEMTSYNKLIKKFKAQIMHIRKGQPNDLNTIMNIYKTAQDFMIESGNPNQWGHTYPSCELIKEDIANEVCYVICDGESIHGVFALFSGEEPTYAYIENGQWLNDDEYVTIHRIASDGKAKGIFKSAVDYCKDVSNNIRIDTHENNKIMQKVIEKNGFQKCGTVYVRDGSPRIAYQWCRKY